MLPLPDAAATPEEWAALRERRRAEITEQITVVLPRAVRWLRGEGALPGGS